MVIVAAAPVWGAVVRIPLPTRPAPIAPPGGLPGKDPLEVDHLPKGGRMSDVEVVRVGLAADGSVDSVVVDQTLTMTGTGDYAFHLPGPALDVTAPPEDATRPGLRRGAVLWQGFSSGKRVLRSTVTLDHRNDIFRRLPVAVAVAVNKDGRATRLPTAGPVRAQIDLTNATAAPVVVYDADPDRTELADLLNDMHNDLAHGRRPLAGRGRIPAAIAGDGRLTHSSVEVIVPIALTATIGFRGEGVSVTRVVGGRRAEGNELRVEAPSLGEVPLSVNATVSAKRLTEIRIEMRAHAILPSARAVASPNTRGWRVTLGKATPAEARRYLALAQVVLWRVLRFADLQAYLGNPAREPSRTEYVFTSVPLRAAPAAPAGRGVRSGGVALAAVAFLLIVGNAVAIWRWA